MTELVTLRVENGVADVTLNRPERKNAITGPLGEALAEQLTRANEDDDAKVILLHGAGGAFCSGLDLKAFNANPAPPWLAEFQHIWRSAHRALFNARKPLVGALERYAINGGAALALACDLLVVGESGFLQVGEVQIGMAAPYNMAWLSLRHPEATMARVALIGDRLSADELSTLNIATSVTSDENVLAAARQLAQRLADYPSEGLIRIKTGLRARVEADADAWFDRFTQNDPVGPRPQPRANPG